MMLEFSGSPCKRGCLHVERLHLGTFTVCIPYAAGEEISRPWLLHLENMLPVFILFSSCCLRVIVTLGFSFVKERGLWG
jgi:hypothetical protein